MCEKLCGIADVYEDCADSHRVTVGVGHLAFSRYPSPFFAVHFLDQIVGDSLGDLAVLRGGHLLMNQERQ